VFAPELQGPLQQRDISETHDSSIRRWMLVPPASGEECVRALGRLGFRVRLCEGDQVLLADGRRAVAVPLVARLRPEVLVSILKSAGVSAVAFTNALDE
jgi:hypothetical protein